jgi:hypothetical protein
LDPEAKYINGILNRSNCMETKNGFFIKDLRIVKNKDLKHMVLVDNLAHSFGFEHLQLNKPLNVSVLNQIYHYAIQE